MIFVHKFFSLKNYRAVIVRMDYCPLSEAFSHSNGHIQSSPEYNGDNVKKNVSRGEKRRLRHSKPIPTTLLIDPDRQHIRKPPDVYPMNKESHINSNRFIENIPDITETFESDYQTSENDKRTDHASDISILSVQANTSTEKKRFFGADPDDDTFADFIPDAKSYLLEPSIDGGAFGVGSLDNAGASKTLPIPSINDVWKPLTPSGNSTSYFNKLQNSDNNTNRGSGMLEKKLDLLFAKLDDLTTNNVENSQTEIMLFIGTGIVVMFLMDLLVKKT